MRDLERNKQTIWYAQYLDKTPIYDDDGNESGEYTVSYSNPSTFRINVSATAGNSRQQAFGYNLEYSRTMVTCNKDFNLNESDVLWIDVIPQLNADGSLVLNDDGTPITPPDYKVSAKGYSQNTASVTFAISKIE